MTTTELHSTLTTDVVHALETYAATLAARADSTRTTQKRDELVKRSSELAALSARIGGADYVHLSTTVQTRLF